jgi:hypothetical protein
MMGLYAVYMKYEYIPTYVYRGICKYWMMDDGYGVRG